MNQSRYAILGLLTFGPMTGYDMKKVITLSLAHFWHESYGNLYPRLEKLKKERLVTVRPAVRQGRSVKVYSITQRGRSALRSWLARPAAPEQIRSEMLLKVFLGAEVPREYTERQVLAHRERQLAYLDALATTEQDIRSAAGDDPNVPFWLMTIRRGKLHAEARLRWCDECLTIVRAMARRARAKSSKKGRQRP